MKYSDSLVSIIIPAFKAEKYIKEALESISIQEHRTWELIVVEDCWADKTEDIVNNFSNTHKSHRIKYVRHYENKGLGATRNTGISYATGKYIAFLDHDDIWKPFHLSQSVAALDSKDGDIVYSSTQMFHSETKKLLNCWGPTEQELNNFPESIYARSFLTPSAVLLRRSVFEKVGIFDTDPNLHFSEDHDYWIRMARAGMKFIHLKRISCLYRKNHLGSATLDSGMIAERELYVLNKHYDWDLIPEKLKKETMAEHYNTLALCNIDINLSKAILIYLKVEILKPFRFFRTMIFIKQLIRNRILRI